MSVLNIGQDVIGKVTEKLGVNIEVHDGEGQTNLWDWLADSGAQIVREFHPEQSLRSPEAATDVWDGVTDRAAFEAFRRGLLEDPENRIPWRTYLFDRPVKWMGVPDRIIENVMRVGVEPICSLGFAPRSYRHSLVKDLEAERYEDDRLDWRAAACAYEYYLAEMYRYSGGHGVRKYLFHNEPEHGWELFYWPERMKPYLSLRTGIRKHPEAGPVYFKALGLQVAAMSRLARWAADDVQALLRAKGRDLRILIAGPTSAPMREQLWAAASPWLDIFDYHCYTRDAGVFREIHRNAGVGAQGKPTSLSEFGRLGGQIPIEEILFGVDASLEVARLLMTMMSLAGPDDPIPSFATFYLFAGPATHRNYKQLVYGDMNMLDWTGTDKALRRRTDAWYPSFEELQIRWATPAYAMFRMLARNAAGLPGAARPFVARGTNAALPGEKAAADALPLECLCVDQGNRMIVNLLNVTEADVEDLEIDLGRDAARFGGGVIRIGSRERRDALDRQFSGCAGVRMTVPGKSLAQVLFVEQDPSRIETLRLREEPFTPGSVKKGLALWQTTRLRV